MKHTSTEILHNAFRHMATAKALTELYEANFKVVSKYVHATSRGHEAIQIALGGGAFKSTQDVTVIHQALTTLAQKVTPDEEEVAVRPEPLKKKIREEDELLLK